ncbi:hypothetical protein ACSQ67_000651 [Phaseolus vulgaris]
MRMASGVVVSIKGCLGQGDMCYITVSRKHNGKNHDGSSIGVLESALGADMYDCVYPTRTTRFGTALLPEGVLKLKHKAMADDTHPIDPTCPCMMESRAKINSPRLRTLMSAIHQKGYAASRSHIATNAIKTNFPMTECIKIAKELLQVSIA